MKKYIAFLIVAIFIFSIFVFGSWKKGLNAKDIFAEKLN